MSDQSLIERYYYNDCDFLTDRSIIHTRYPGDFILWTLYPITDTVSDVQLCGFFNTDGLQADMLITEIEGLASQAETALLKSQISYDYARLRNVQTSGRTIKASIAIVCDNATTLQQQFNYVQQMRYPFKEVRPIFIYLPKLFNDEIIKVYGVIKDTQMTIDTYTSGGIIKLDLMIRTFDSRIYSNRTYDFQLTTAPSLPNHWMPIPLYFPWRFLGVKSGVSEGEIQTSLMHAYDIPLIIKLHGDLDYPVITNMTTGEVCYINKYIDAAETYIIDSRTMSCFSEVDQVIKPYSNNLLSLDSQFLALKYKPRVATMHGDKYGNRFKIETKTPSTVGYVDILVKDIWM